MQLLILQKFHVFDPPSSDTRKVFEPGMVVDSTELPADQSAEGWIAAGLAREAHAHAADQ